MGRYDYNDTGDHWKGRTRGHEDEARPKVVAELKRNMRGWGTYESGVPCSLRDEEAGPLDAADKGCEELEGEDEAEAGQGAVATAGLGALHAAVTSSTEAEGRRDRQVWSVSLAARSKRRRSGVWRGEHMVGVGTVVWNRPL